MLTFIALSCFIIGIVLVFSTLHCFSIDFLMTFGALYCFIIDFAIAFSALWCFNIDFITALRRVGDRRRERPEGSLFSSYYTNVLGRALLLSLDCSTLPLILTLYCWVLNKDVSNTIIKVLGMTRPGIEPMSPRPLENTQSNRPMNRFLLAFRTLHWFIIDFVMASSSLICVHIHFVMIFGVFYYFIILYLFLSPYIV